MNIHDKEEPKPIWVLSLKDLSQETAPACYLVTPNRGEQFEIILKKRKRQVLDTLLMSPVFCASTVRIGDVIFRLKEDDNLHGETQTLSSGRKYYSLNGTVQTMATAPRPPNGGTA